MNQLNKPHKAIIITDVWAGVLGTLMTTCIIGGVTYAWNAHSQTAVLQRDVTEMKQANLPSRLDKLEENVKTTKESVIDLKDDQKAIRAQIYDVSRKLDILLGEQKARKRTLGGHE